MPHVNDRARLKQYHDLLFVPQDVLRAVAVDGRIELDTGHQGQASFQALLWDLLFSRGHDHPWDHGGGRSFPDLALYISWIVPKPRTLVIQTSVAPRVANYLLPRTRTFADGSYVHFGIPGLRIERVTGRSVHLLHLPTEGRLELRDYSPGTARSMRSRLRWETGADEKPDNLAFWHKASVTPAEEATAPHWTVTPCTPLRSALMVRGILWWSHYPHTAELIPPRRSNTSRCLQWRNGPTCTEMGDLLVNSAVRIPGATHTARTGWSDVSLLKLHEAAIELTGPDDRQPLPAPTRNAAELDAAIG
ncbi:hypothetical protein ATKI12_8849 [Kitasatospora sp. Ki12]